MFYSNNSGCLHWITLWIRWNDNRAKNWSNARKYARIIENTPCRSWKLGMIIFAAQNFNKNQNIWQTSTISSMVTSGLMATPLRKTGENSPSPDHVVGKLTMPRLLPIARTWRSKPSMLMSLCWNVAKWISQMRRGIQLILLHRSLTSVCDTEQNSDKQHPTAHSGHPPSPHLEDCSSQQVLTSD